MFKKIILAALLVATASFAQLGFGVHAAGTMSSLWGEDAGNSASGMGFSAGATAKIGIPFIAVVPEVLIDMRNYTLDDDGDVTLTQWDLEIPVMVRLSILPILFVEAGPTFAFNLSSTEEIDGKEYELPDDAFNSFEFGLAFGLGTGIIPMLDIDFRVNLGLTKVLADYDLPMIGTVEAPEIKNLQFALGVSYWF